MKISATFSKPKIKYNSFKELFPQGLAISAAVFAAGIIVSSVVFVLNKVFISEKIDTYFNYFYLSASSKNFIEIFCGSILVILPFYVLLVIFGTSVYGSYAGLAMLFFKSFGMGAVVSFLFYKYQLKGIEYFLLVFLISKLILVFDLLFISQNCVSSSQKIKKLAEKEQSDSFDFKLYRKKCLFAFAVMIISCLTEAVCIKIFSSLFDF